MGIFCAQAGRKRTGQGEKGVFGESPRSDEGRGGGSFCAKAGRERVGSGD